MIAITAMVMAMAMYMVRAQYSQNTSALTTSTDAEVVDADVVDVGAVFKRLRSHKSGRRDIHAVVV